MPWTDEQKEEALRKHYAWLVGEEGGERLVVHNDELAGVDLEWANLEEAALEGADLRQANFIKVTLKGANLRGANLEGANLEGINIRWANLEGANLDFFCWPLCCGSRDVVVDSKLFRQLVDHLLALRCNDDEAMVAQKLLRENVSRSHRAEDLGLC